MNALSLVNRVTRRLPGYTQAEYLDEVNEAYQWCWNFILQLEDSYFTEVKQVTVQNSGAEFDFLWNENGNLASTLSNRYFQITRIRILPPGGGSWLPTQPMTWNSPAFLSAQSNANPPDTATGPFYWIPFSKGSVLFALPIVAGTIIEVTYNLIFLPLYILTNGTVSNTGTAVMGTSTNFNQICGPDYQASLPGSDTDSEVGAELIVPANAAGLTPTYTVKQITSATALVTQNAISPALVGSAYTLASVPDIPMGSHECISTIATRNILSTPGNDPRYAQWAQMAEEQIQMMKDTVMLRQKQAPARRRRFPYAVFSDYVAPASR